MAKIDNENKGNNNNAETNIKQQRRSRQSKNNQ